MSVIVRGMSALVILVVVPAAVAGVNNLNPPHSLCLDIRNIRPVNAEGICASEDSDCPGELQCSDDDMDPLNGGVCVDEAVYLVGDTVIVDVELGPTTQLVCGGQVFLEWDTDTLALTGLALDPDGEYDAGNGGGGWIEVFSVLDVTGGTLDLAMALDQGVACNSQNGTVSGGTMLRMSFLAMDICSPVGVRFRPSQFPTSVSGIAGQIPTYGCNDSLPPSPTDDFLIGMPCVDDGECPSHECDQIKGVCWCCETIEECADTDGDGLRDDNCVWWACEEGLCVATDTVFADMGGEFGACSADGAADGSDRFHALNCFADVDAEQMPGYPCEPHPPHALNVDAGGALGSCVSDGVCDANDAFHALAVLGNLSPCTCPANGPQPAALVAPFVVDTARINLSPGRLTVEPGDTFSIEVSLTSSLSELRGYQLHLGARGGTAGAVLLDDIAVEQPGVLGPAAWMAFNTTTAQVACGLDTLGAATPARAYLATFTYRVTPDARGTFLIDVLHDTADPAHRTFLFSNALAGAIEIAPVAPVIVTVQKSSFGAMAP